MSQSVENTEGNATHTTPSAPSTSTSAPTDTPSTSTGTTTQNRVKIYEETRPKCILRIKHHARANEQALRRATKVKRSRQER